MTVQYFSEVYEAINKSRQLKRENKIPDLRVLISRLNFAEACLKQAEDRWDYDSIKGSIEYLKYQIEISKKFKKEPDTFLPDEEVNEALDHYEADYAKVAKKYNDIWANLDKLKENFLSESRKMLQELEEIEKASEQAYSITNHVPLELAQSVPKRLKRGSNILGVGDVDNFKMWLNKEKRSVQ